MASLKLLVCCLLVALAYSQPDFWINPRGYGGPPRSPGGGYGEPPRPPWGGYGEPPRPVGGGYGQPANSNGGYGGPSITNGGYGDPRPGGSPSTGGGSPATGGYGSSITGGGSPATGSGTNTGGSECKCKIPQMQCVSIRTPGNTAKCDAGFTPASCVCSGGCGLYKFEDSTCICSCFEPEWTSVRCCRNI